MAVAYALRPKLLFLDEPTSGVSTRDKTQIMDTVSSVVRAGAVTAVVIEHDMDVVFRYSDRIVMMHEGAFLADGHAGRDQDEQGRRQYPARRRRSADAIRKKVKCCLRSTPSISFAAPRTSFTGYRSASGRTRSSPSSVATAPAAPPSSRASSACSPSAPAGSAFADEDITGLPPHKRAKRGIGYAPENRRSFPS